MAVCAYYLESHLSTLTDFCTSLAFFDEIVITTLNTASLALDKSLSKHISKLRCNVLVHHTLWSRASLRNEEIYIRPVHSQRHSQSKNTQVSLQHIKSKSQEQEHQEGAFGQREWHTSFWVLSWGNSFWKANKPTDNAHAVKELQQPVKRHIAYIRA